MTVDLYRAPARYREEFIDESPVAIPRPTAPRFVRRVRVQKGPVLVGRHPTEALEPGHLAWTSGCDPAEDLRLSRAQLELRCADGGWWLTVPGEPDSKPGATVQYWASENNRTLVAGGTALLLDPSSHLCVVVHTDDAFYWALLSTPPGPQSGPRVGPVHGTLGGIRTDHKPPPSAPFPNGWREAVLVKFRPYLTWPMGWRPAPVEPRNYRDPRTGRTGVSSRFQSSVKHRLLDTKKAAVDNGYTPATPNGVEVTLLSWLVEKGKLTFDVDRCEWPEDGD